MWRNIRGRFVLLGGRGCRLSVVSYRLSVIGCELSVVSYRLSVIGCQLSVVSCELWVMGYGLWVMGYGLWVMGYGLWVMGYGLWVMGYGYFDRLRMTRGCGLWWVLSTALEMTWVRKDDGGYDKRLPRCTAFRSQ
jgi:hypothetical protein